MIILTAHDNDADCALALRSGAAGYLAKQLTAGPELRAALQQAWHHVPADAAEGTPEQQLVWTSQRLEQVERENQHLRQLLAERERQGGETESDYPLFGDVVLSSSLMPRALG